MTIKKKESTTNFFACINNYSKKLNVSLLKQIVPFDDFTQNYALMWSTGRLQ